MIIGIVGPNDIKYLKNVNSSAEILLVNLAKILAKSKHEILLTPEKGSVLELIGKHYIQSKGKKIKEIVPLDDDYDSHLNVTLGEIISCSKWENQPSIFNKNCELIICVGYGAMVLSEIGYSRYYNPKKIYVIKELVTAEMPREVNESLEIEYVSIKDLSNILFSINDPIEVNI